MPSVSAENEESSEMKCGKERQQVFYRLLVLCEPMDGAV